MSITSEPTPQTPTTPPVAETADPSTPIQVLPAIQKSQDAFRRALPELLKTKTEAQRWVAFCGDDLITFGRTKTEAYQECLRRGLKRGTFVVRIIEPEVLDDVEIMWDA